MEPKKTKSKLASDALKISMPVVVPIAVEFIINKIPVGSKLDDVIRDYDKYWEKVVPLVSGLVLQLTNMPEFVDEIVAEVGAEVVRALKKRNSEESSTSEVKKSVKENFFSISYVMATAKTKDMIKFQELLKSISEKQKKSVLGYGLNEKEDVKILFHNFISMTETQFKDWVEIMFPAEKPREKPEFEKKAEESLKKFGEDSNSFFSKETWLEKSLREAKAKRCII